MAIPDIDGWNARLNPRAKVDSNTSDSTYPEVDCEPCCEHPKCCPPKLECQSISAQFERLGYPNLDDSTSDSSDTLYLKKGFTTTRSGDTTEESGDTTEDCGYSKRTWTVTATHFQGFEFTRSYRGGIGDGGSSSGDCPFYPTESGTDPSCSASGTSTQSNFSTACYGDGVEEQTRNYGRDSHYVWTIEDAEGDTTPAFTAWREEFPTDGDYDTALADYTAYLAAYAAWEIEYQEWVDGGEVGDPPVQPDAVAEPNARPTEFFPKCWWKIRLTVTIDPHYFGFNSDGSSAEPDPTGSDYNFTDWIADEASGPPPESGTGSFIASYTDSPISGLPSPVGSTDTEVPSYLEPVTYEEWKAAVKALIDAEDFPHDSCALTQCSAYREITATTYSERFFRYRWKLNKCCGTYSALAWLEVFYDLAFLAWLDSVASDPGPAPSTPTPTTKAWEWTGTRDDADCDDSTSDSTPLDPFDAEDHWSTWSAKVSIGAGLEGLIRLRSLYMVCWRSSRYGTKPDRVEPLTGDLGIYDPSDLNENGIADSQE